MTNNGFGCPAGFFSQFGRVTKVRVSRSKKTGKAKHYAFMEFQYPEVAKIAAEAMNNYMMFKEKLVVTVVPTQEVHPDLWKGANRKFRAYPWRKVERERHNAVRTPEEQVVPGSTLAWPIPVSVFGVGGLFCAGPFAKQFWGLVLCPCFCRMFGKGTCKILLLSPYVFYIIHSFITFYSPWGPHRP